MTKLTDHIKDFISGKPGREISTGLIVQKVGSKYVSMYSLYDCLKTIKMSLKDFAYTYLPSWYDNI